MIFTPKAEFAVIGSDCMKAVIIACNLRRKGFMVETQFSGSRKKQYKRAIGMAHKVIDIDKPEDMAFVEAM